MSRIDGLIAQYCPDGVEFRALGDIAQVLNGYSFKSSKYSNKGIRVIRISDVQKGKISDKSLKFYPIETKKEIEKYLLTENDIVMSLTGYVGRVAMLSANDLPAGLNQRVACIRVNTKEILTRYLFHFFDQDAFENDAMSNATGGGQQNMSTRWLSSYPIPVPPLEVQEEIVKILDIFTEVEAGLEAGLEAELEARQQQYSHYRAVLLNFDDDEVEWMTLECVASSISAGGDLPKKYLKGQKTPTEEFPYPIYSNGMNEKSIYGFTNDYRIDSEAVTISARGTIGWHTIRQPKFTPIVRLIVLIPITSIISSKFLNYILDITEIGHSGGSIPQLTVPNVKKIKIPVPSLKEQERIVAILDKFGPLVNDISNALPAEINLRRQQYQYYRHKLLTFKKT